MESCCLATAAHLRGGFWFCVPRPYNSTMLDSPLALSYDRASMSAAPECDFITHLKTFTLHPDRASKTRVETVAIDGHAYSRFINEFWTSRQRQASTLHEIAYRACFKPQLPRFFIERLTREDDVVYDPFAGRGTTIVEAALMGRNVIGNDINPLSNILTLARLRVPNLNDLQARLASIPVAKNAKAEIDLEMFYQRDTLGEIVSLRNYLRARRESGNEDALDAWIRMVATNRLTGHSSGFFSVYTLPPNQAVSPQSQRKINARRKQKPAYRDTRALILKKSRQLVSKLSAAEQTNFARAAAPARFFADDARRTAEIADESVQLTVTSPPFLDVVQYAQDNWLRCWFNCIDAQAVASKITSAKTIAAWEEVMQAVFVELYRVTRRGGWVAFEVGEVKAGRVRLDEHVVPLGVRAGFACEGILVNEQSFTKTANIWGVSNNQKGTNTNRVVIFSKC